MRKRIERSSAYERAYVVLNYLKKHTNEDNKVTIAELKEKDEIKDVVKDKTALYNLIREYVILTADKENESRILCNNIERFLDMDEDEKNIRLGKIYYKHAFSYDEIGIVSEALRFCRSIDTKTADRLIDKLHLNLSDEFYNDHKAGIHNVKEINLTDKKELRKNLLIIQEAIDKSNCINFYFNGYDNNKNLHRVKEKKYIVTPYYIVAYNWKYYLIAATKKYKSMSIWRIDLMSEIEHSDFKENKEHNLHKSDVENLPQQWNDNFIYSHPDMCYDRPINITLELNKNEKFNGADYTFIYDLFGDTFRTIKQCEGYDIVSVNSSPFAITNLALKYADRIEVIEPNEVRDMVVEKINYLKDKYKYYI